MLASDEPEPYAVDQSLTALTPISRDRPALKIIRATAAELEAHEQRLADISKAVKGPALWQQ